MAQGDGGPSEAAADEGEEDGVDVEEVREGCLPV